MQIGTSPANHGQRAGGTIPLEQSGELRAIPPTCRRFRQVVEREDIQRLEGLLSYHNNLPAGRMIEPPGFGGAFDLDPRIVPARLTVVVRDLTTAL